MLQLLFWWSKKLKWSFNKSQSTYKISNSKFFFQNFFIPLFNISIGIFPSYRVRATYLRYCKSQIMMEKRVNLRNLDLRPGQDFINVVYFDQQTLVETSFLVASVGGFSLNFFFSYHIMQKLNICIELTKICF